MHLYFLILPCKRAWRVIFYIAFWIWIGGKDVDGIENLVIRWKDREKEKLDVIIWFEFYREKSHKMKPLIPLFYLAMAIDIYYLWHLVAFPTVSTRETLGNLCVSSAASSFIIWIGEKRSSERQSLVTGTLLALWEGLWVKIPVLVSFPRIFASIWKSTCTSMRQKKEGRLFLSWLLNRYGMSCMLYWMESLTNISGIWISCLIHSSVSIFNVASVVGKK